MAASDGGDESSSLEDSVETLLLRPREDGAAAESSHGHGHPYRERRRSQSHSPTLQPLHRHHHLSDSDAEVMVQRLSTAVSCTRPLLLLVPLLLVLVLASFASKQLFLSDPYWRAVLAPSPALFSSDLSSPSSSCSPASVAAPASPAFHTLFPVPAGRTLFLIVHSTHDSTYPDNLAYFIRKGVRCWHDADYVFIIQRNDAASLNATDPNAEWRRSLPPLPPNARYVLHINECMDIGSVGWFLHLPPTNPDYVDTGVYRYFFFINTSSRGPILPPYLEERMDVDGRVQCAPGGAVVGGEDVARALFPWFHVFLAKLDDDVKLVGCTINCAFAAHIQSYILAMDYISLQILWQSRGLEVDDINGQPLKERFVGHQLGVATTSAAQLELRRTPRRPLTLERDLCRWREQGGLQGTPGNFSMVLACHVDFWDTVFNAEIGTSQAVLKAGFNIAALELFWRGVDFRLAPPVCALMHPPEMHANHYQEGVPANRLGPWDGIYHFNDPHHVVFTKYKTALKYGSEQDLKAILAWEALHNRTLAWQQTHHQTVRPIHRGYPQPLTNLSDTNDQLH